jgi:4-hydroxymandelate oxidase
MSMGRDTSDVKKIGQPIVSLDGYEAEASSILNRMAFDYIASGTGDGHTLRRNRAAFQEIEVLPRVLTDVSKIGTRVEILGRIHEFPLLLAPTGYHKLFHADGELETVRGANASQATLIASCFSTTAYEEMRKASANPLWFQLYINPDRGFTRELVASVVQAGCEAICLTVDVPVNQPKDSIYSTPFSLPEGLMRANLLGLGADVASASHRTVGRNIYNYVRASNATWKDVEWLRSILPIPLLLKGILRIDDAHHALDLGCEGIIVSNHGGRALDGVPATIEILPGIAQSLNGKGLIIMDGGIRRGTDVLKAIALGANAVMIGRPYLFGLAVQGAKGVRGVVEMLRTEVEMAMALAGCASIADIDRTFLRNR